jgi:serine protein kinase
MSGSLETIEHLKQDIQAHFQAQRVILSFGDFLDLVTERPEKMMRSAAAYLRDAFDHFGSETVMTPTGSARRFKLFDHGTERNGPIIGGESVQEEIYRILNSFIRQGQSNKLILLHGPNGSAKSSTIEAIAYGMQRYSESDDGSIYSFNWIFPTEKSANPSTGGDAGPIGFTGGYPSRAERGRDSYALIDESKVACKLHSEFHDNPIYLLPMPQREQLLRKWVSAKSGIPEADVELPSHVLLPGLSKRNQLIFENLLAAYDGDLTKVLRHVQVERFYYSKQYRVGFASVEPQMSIDATERQLTMDKNIMNLPTFLNNIRFHEAHGQLIEANRGVLEFSDMLKRPVEAFKYLLTTVEKGTLSLPSCTADLDIVFFGTTNEKHLDAFKTLPDFSSFRSRFELVTVPYLLEPKREVSIYEPDVRALGKNKVIAPHSVYCLCLWAAMTRLKQPDPEYYESKHRALIARLDPRSKITLYEGDSLMNTYKSAEETIMRDLKAKVYTESVGVPVYEGRFGASPREVRGILYRAAENPRFKTLTPMAIFAELRRLVRDKTVYEFLQFEPRGKYHDAERFIEIVEEDFAQTFENEVLQAMTLVEEHQYELHLQRYIDHAVAFVRKEKIYNQTVGAYEECNTNLLKDFEKIVGVTGSVDRHRQGLLARIAASKLDHPSKAINTVEIFQDLLKKMRDHYHDEQRKVVDSNFKAMIQLDSDERKNLAPADAELAEQTFANLEKRFAYDRHSVQESLRFLMAFPKKPAA